MPFDYSLPAEIFMESRKGGGRPVGYDVLGLEELPAYPALQTWMNVGDERFDGNAIRRLYESPEYPLPRSTQ
jgi:hypothetical protein